MMKIIRPLSIDDLVELDVAEFLEDEAQDFEWNLCEVTVSELTDFAKESWDEAWRSLVRIERTEEDATERFNSIIEWLKDGIEPLRKRPIVLLKTGDWDLVDGYHRVAVVAHLLKLPSSIAAVGIDPSMTT
jgi:hypothetical protein